MRWVARPRKSKVVSSWPPHDDVADAAAAATAAAAVPTADNFKLGMTRFDAYFNPKSNVIHERAKFHLRVQQASEKA